ncbi:helix-turn-helix domain-containing protein [Emergencia timonensis]|uniref:helix-turn-helix domain-containing protein n=1 Tax=Emergencia timonensis TaxID=1776384 RepID=UPI001D05EDBA|nr:helix-turn-helix transcriptional regulator [Emergencia timonensis]MCB6475556.1 helix-turn-helix domain-containing protein [Emergencia timonensis]
MAFNDRLKELRERKGISQASLADDLGVSKSAISMYERGERNPDFETLETIADYFNVDMNYLLCKEDRSIYYLDPEAAEMAQEMYDRPEMKVLFDASRKATKEDIEQVAEILKKLGRK